MAISRLTFNYLKPRAALGFRKSAEVYFGEGSALDVDGDVRASLARAISDATFALGSEDRDRMKRRTREQMHRKTVRLALQRLGLYHEWDVTALKGPPEADVVNRT